MTRTFEQPDARATMTRAMERQPDGTLREVDTPWNARRTGRKPRVGSEVEIRGAGLQYGACMGPRTSR